MSDDVRYRRPDADWGVSLSVTGGDFIGTRVECHRCGFTWDSGYAEPTVVLAEIERHRGPFCPPDSVKETQQP